MIRQSGIAFLLLVILACFGCTSTRSGNTAVGSDPQSIPGDSLLVGIQRGACFGACPQYKATVYKSGLAVYEGEKNVKKTGVWFAKLTETQLEELHELLLTYRMEEKDTAYINKYLADYPAYYLTVCYRRPRKTILVNHESPPVEITEYTQLLEQMLDRLHWIPRERARQSEE